MTTSILVIRAGRSGITAARMCGRLVARRIQDGFFRKGEMKR
jgi:hypothetical protein